MKTRISSAPRWRTMILLTIGLLLFTACGAPEAAPDEGVPVSTSGNTVPAEPEADDNGATADNEATQTDVTKTTDTDVISAQNRFGLKLYEKLIAQNEDGDNVFISPTSIAMALALAYNGAEGDTAAAMAETLQLAGIPQQDINAAFLALLAQLDEAANPELGVQLNIANSIWHDDEFAVNEQYIQRMLEYYRAHVAGLDFGDPASVGVINGWIADNTNDLITELIERLDRDTVMMLVNAVYFKGDWADPFMPEATRKQPFVLADGELTEVDMMYKDGMLEHYQGNGFHAIRLPYGDDERLGFYAFVPQGDNTLADFHQQLTYENWNTWLNGFTPKQGQLYLPRLDIGYKVNLNDVLADLGMGIAFNAAQANFDGMKEPGTQGRLSISDVLHETALIVNEEGTEAAAATSIGVRLTSMPMYKFEFKADRPFFLAIRDDVTGTLLFAGNINNPNA